MLKGGWYDEGKKRYTIASFIEDYCKRNYPELMAEEQKNIMS